MWEYKHKEGQESVKECLTLLTQEQLGEHSAHIFLVEKSLVTLDTITTKAFKICYMDFFKLNLSIMKYCLK